MLKRLRSPWVVLFFLSPLLAELMTSSAPPLEFFNPVGFFFICTWYGCGVLFIREIAFRKRLNWEGILFLGMGFGILEEAIFVKTFFDPHAVDLGIFATFGRIAGINIPWAAYLTLFHGLHSILFPILMTYILFVNDIKRPWLSKRGVTLCGIILSAFSVIGWFLFDPAESGTPYIPSSTHFVASLAVIFVIGLISLQFTNSGYYLSKITKKLRRTLLFLGIITGFLFSFGVWIVADLFRNVIISVFYVVVIALIIMYTEKRIIKNNLPSFCYFIIGNLLVWSFLGFLQEFSGALGMSVTGIGFIVFFCALVWHLNTLYTDTMEEKES